MKLYLVRHGQSTGNVAGTLLGQGDHPLTGLGEKQARAAAARLAPFGPMPLHCSDLARAVAKRLGGQTGDVYGLGIELAEAVALVAGCALVKLVG